MDRWNIRIGGFIAGVDSTVRIGLDNLSAGLDIDLEDALNLEKSVSAFRIDGRYRFGKGLRHQVRLEYSAYHREAIRTIAREIEFGDETYPIGTTVDSLFNLDIIKGSYSYSFLKDDRFDVGGSIGLFVLPIEAGINAAGVGAEKEDFTAPLPVIGIRAAFALTEKLYLNQNIEVFYLSLDSFSGSLTNLTIALEYDAWKNVGLGIAYDVFNIGIKAEGDDYPGVDFVGDIDFGNSGLQLYAKIHF